MAIELPSFDLRRVKPENISANGLPSIELPHMELPKVELPNVELPKVEMPKVDLSNVDLPRLDLPAIGKRIDNVGRDLRSLRVVRQPSASEATARAASMTGIGLLAGLGCGIALMYFFDPRVGRARRQRLTDRITAFVASIKRTIGGAGGSDPYQALDRNELEERYAGPSDATEGFVDEVEASDTLRVPELATQG